MNTNRKRQSQFELFPGVSKSDNAESHKIHRLTKDLTLSLENIIVLCIIFVMIVVLFFSFGVEKGKRIAMLNVSGRQSNVLKADAKTVDSQSGRSSIGQQPKSQVVFPTDAANDANQGSGKPADVVPTEDIGAEEELFTIQVASFKLKKNAQREAQRLKSGGHEDIFVIAKGSHSIVCVGKFAKRIEAKLFSNKLKSRYNDCLVRSL